MSDTTPAFRAHVERLFDEAMADTPVTLTYNEALELEAEARADADAQVAALRTELEIIHGRYRHRCPGAVCERALALLRDTE